MASEIIAEIRARAAQARRIADKMHGNAQLELRQMADALEDHADELERGDLRGPIQPGSTA